MLYPPPYGAIFPQAIGIETGWRLTRHTEIHPDTPTKRSKSAYSTLKLIKDRLRAYLKKICLQWLYPTSDLLFSAL